MADEQLEVVRLQNKFYQDGFYKVLIAIIAMLIAIFLLISASIYLLSSKPEPVVFAVGNEYRVLAEVPLEKSYLETPDLIQWVSNVIPSAFTYDFMGYTDELKNQAQYFTADGWKKLLSLLNVYASYNDIQNSKIFLKAEASGAPYVINQGILQGKYSWWIQMPILLSYSNMSKEWNQPLIIQALVVRVPTLNNLYGVGIENILVVAKDNERGA